MEQTQSRYIRQKIKDFAQQRNQAVTTVAIPRRSQQKSGMSFLTGVLGFMILLMSLVTFYGMARRRMQPDMRPQPPVAQRPDYMSASHAAAWMSNIEGRMSNIEGKLDSNIEKDALWNHRVFLLGVAHNENANLARHNQQPGSKDFIMFDEQWRISKMPETLTLSDEARRNLQRSLK